jgi:tRNA (cmo5U34)-methyltransferase
VRQPNVDYWAGREVTAYERKQRLLVPRKDEILETVVDLIPFPEDAAIAVLDVGAGQGALAERVLRRFPRAHVTLLDASQEMLAVAEERLAPYALRYTALLGDYNAPGWHEAIRRPVHAVVSVLALHYLRTERRELFFRDAYALLEAPGYLANGGGFLSENERVQAYNDGKRLAFTQRQLAAEGRAIALEELRARWRHNSEQAGVNAFTLVEQVRLLEGAGFAQVEIVWRYLSLAVVVGYKCR